MDNLKIKNKFRDFSTSNQHRYTKKKTKKRIIDHTPDFKKNKNGRRLFTSSQWQ